MKRTDEVYFFTLVDLFLQVIFVGVFLFAITLMLNEDDKKSEVEPDKELLSKIEKAAKEKLGISNFVELFDFLTRLAPADKRFGDSDFIARNGGKDEIARTKELSDRVGGYDKLKSIVDKSGYGLPPCLQDASGNVQTLATVFAYDDRIEFEKETEELAKLLKRINKNYSDVETLSLKDFRYSFELVGKEYPGCKYSLVFIEKTRFVDARDAARFIFTLNIKKR